MAKIGVVGAGIVGRLLSWRLVKRGHAVTLFDQHDWESRAACSWAAAGLLAPIAESATSGEQELAVLGARSLAEWPRIASALPGPLTILTAGSLALAHEQDAGDLIEFQQRLTGRFPNVQAVRLDRDALVRLEPALAQSSFSMGLHLEGEGAVHSHEAMISLAAVLPRLGVDCQLDTPVIKLERHSVMTPTGTETFELVVDCRGLGARFDLPELRGVRGEIIEVKAPGLELKRPIRVLHQRYPVYIVPRGVQTYAIGATCLETDSMAPVSVKAALELLGAAYAAHPAFRYGEVTGMTANCRPAYADNLPKIHREPGLMRINGLYRHGFLLSPLMTDLACRLIDGGAPLADEAWLVREAP